MSESDSEGAPRGAVATSNHRGRVVVAAVQNEMAVRCADRDAQRTEEGLTAVRRGGSVPSKAHCDKCESSSAKALIRSRDIGEANGLVNSKWFCRLSVRGSACRCSR